MQADKKQEELLEKAKGEENAYNWREAAKLYENVVKYFSDKKMVNKTAEAYKKLGDVYNYIAETAITREEFIGQTKNAINAYNEAANLFSQMKNKAKELECIACASCNKGLMGSSVIEVREAFHDASRLFIESSDFFSKDNNQEGMASALSKATVSLYYLIFSIQEKSEIDKIYQKGIDIANKAYRISREIGNIRFLSDTLFAETMLNVAAIFFKNFKQNKVIQENFRKSFSRSEEDLKLIIDSDDPRAIATIYAGVGSWYCLYASHLIESEDEQRIWNDKGLNLLEISLIYSRKANYNYMMIICLYSLPWWAYFGRKYKYVQKRIFNDVNKCLELSKVYSGVHNMARLFADLVPIFYYTNMAQRSFFKTEQRKSFAKQGIMYAEDLLKNFSSCPLSGWIYNMLTYSYSQLTTLSSSKDEQQQLAEKMYHYSQKAKEIAEKIEGGVVGGTCYSSLYKANKTLADLTEDKESKIQMMLAAADANKKYLELTTESRVGILWGQVRQGLLYEEIGIISKDPKPLIQAKDYFLNVNRESIEYGFLSYVASTHEYLARIEDRLGNHNISADHYQKAKEAYSESIERIEYKLLRDRTKEKIEYASAWNLIEMAKTYHKREDHLKAKDCYEKASEILESISKYRYEAPYYASWAILEEAEHLSKQEYQERVIEKYEMSQNSFENAIKNLEQTSKKVKEKHENDRIEKLKKVAKLRIDYCSARINIENARILGRQGNHIEAAEQFAIAASQFKTVCATFKIERERKELEAIYFLCRAWENMELAENNEDSERFADAAKLFINASKLFEDTKLKLLSSGNSTFCQALEYGCKFDESIEIQIKTELYKKVKTLLRKAASTYVKCGFKSQADWALATSTYFDAAWHLIKADEELKLNEREKLLGIGSRYLKAAAELFGKAGFREKEKEIQNRLTMLEKEEKILVSALNTIERPSISKSTMGIVAPTCPIEIAHTTKISEIQQITDELRRVKETKLEDSPQLYEFDTSLNIIHLSDIQEGRFGIKEDISTGSEGYYNYLSDLESKLEILHRKDKIDFVVISGDLASTGSKEEYDNLTQEFIPILNEIFLEGINVVPKHRWIIVPGNHDVEWDKADARYNNFIQFCQDNGFHQYKLNDPEAIYSDIVCKEINTGNTFGIIGLNSCLEILDETSRNESNISKSYFSGFSKTWDNSFREIPKLMVCHHMLHTRDNNVLLSLAGDIHKSDSHADEISKIRCIPAGTISASKSEREFGIDAVSRQFNLINLNLQSGYVKWYTYILEGTWREIKNESFYLEHASFSKMK